MSLKKGRRSARVCFHTAIVPVWFVLLLFDFEVKGREPSISYLVKHSTTDPLLPPSSTQPANYKVLQEATLPWASSQWQGVPRRKGRCAFGDQRQELRGMTHTPTTTLMLCLS